MSGEIARLHELYRTGRTSPTEVVDEQFVRARAAAAEHDAFTALFPERARAAAQASTARFARGTPRSLLDGVPVTVQDLLSVRADAGGGSEGAVVRDEAAIVSRLRAQGAIVIGTTRLSPDGAGGVPYGSLHNPWPGSDGERVGGAAAAMAMGIGFASLGLDACGSMLNPAAWCGTVGLKPTQDALPRTGALPLSPTLDHMAILARRVEDARLVLQVLTSAARRRTSRAGRGSPSPLRIGAAVADGMCPDVVARCKEVLSRLGGEGAEIVEVEGLPLRAASAAALAIFYAEALELHGERLKRHWHAYSPAIRNRAMAGTVVRAVDYVRARAVRDTLRSEWPRLLARAGVDLVALPTVPCGAPPQDRPAGHTGHVAATKATALYASPFDLLGVPAVTVPVGQDDGGMPVGLEIAGSAGDDQRCLDAAARVEAVRGAWPGPPGFARTPRVTRVPGAGRANLPVADADRGCATGWPVLSGGTST